MADQSGYQPLSDTESIVGAARPLDPGRGEFAPGSRIGDYEIVSAIGSGGMGEVYRVRNVISDRTEAMKVLRSGLTRDPELAERFMREIKTQAALHHPNIASLHTAFHWNDQIVMILEFVNGRSLDRLLEQGPMPLRECLACVSQVLQALNYAHQSGVIHRDIKPSNIMVMTDGSVKLMDFGIAQVAADPKLTSTGVTVGSPYYMSPEQIRGATPDARSDIYSLGITLYELITGRRAIQGDSEFAIKSAHLNDVPTPPIALDHTLPPALNDIVLIAISKQPEQRFQTANAFLNAIESVRAQLPAASGASAPGVPITAAPVIATPPPLPAPPPRPAKSHRAAYMVIGAVAAVIALAVLGLEAPKWFGTSAHPADVPSRTAVPKVQPEAQPQQAATPPAQPEPPQPQPSSTAAPQTAPTERTSAPPVSLPNIPNSSAPARAVQPARDRRSAVQSSDARPAQAEQAEPRQLPPSAPVVPPTTPAAPAAPAVSTADLQKVEDRMSEMTSRMHSLDRSLQRLEQSQNASGLGIRSDWAQARDMMHSFFNQAESALRNQDPAAANRYLDRADIQVDKLAKALNQ